MEMRYSLFGSIAMAGLLAVSSAAAAALPVCAGPVAPLGFDVLRVDTNGVLTLKGGRTAVLEGLRLPKGNEDGAQQTRQALSGMVAGAHVTLGVSVPKEDRHGRWRAQVSVNGEWVQETLLRLGLARVALLPSHPQCAREMYAAEAAARAAKRGLWAGSTYAVRSPDDLAHDRGTFQIVQGRVIRAAVKQGRAYLNFSNDWKHDFTVTISPQDLKTFRKAKVDPRDYAGKTVRVRGMIDWYRGPEVELMGPESVEVLP